MKVKQHEKYMTDPIFSEFDYPMTLKVIKEICTFEKKCFNKFEGNPMMSIEVYTFQTDAEILPMNI